MVHAFAQRAWLATLDWQVPASPLLPDVVMPKNTIGAPGECKIEITLALQRRVIRIKNHIVTATQWILPVAAARRLTSRAAC
jgi:hypothetical protein